MAVYSPHVDSHTRQARWFRLRRAGSKVLFLVFHDMEAPETATMAEDLGNNWFANPTGADGQPVKVSTHVGIDSDTVAAYLPEDVAAFGSHGNDLCVHVEHAGYARQSRNEWLDAYGVAMLDRSARWFAERCHAYGLPPKFVDAAGVEKAVATLNPRDGGWTTHMQMTKSLGKGRGHVDPGPFFPEDWYGDRIVSYYRNPRRRPVLVRGDHVGKASLGASAGTVEGGRVTGAVADLQRFLKREGYDLGRFGPLGDGVDGDLGTLGIEAVVQCRADNELPAASYVDDAFWSLVDGVDIEPPVDPSAKLIVEARRHLLAADRLLGKL